MSHRFHVFGRTIAIERSEAGWSAFHVSDDGKRRPASLAIPSDVLPAELAQYLYDIYHESATPTNGDVFEIDPVQRG
jgi:thiamine pyrophosphate-dependent acetolactate synthase large subunit-like protein